MFLSMAFQIEKKCAIGNRLIVVYIFYIALSNLVSKTSIDFSMDKKSPACLLILVGFITFFEQTISF